MPSPSPEKISPSPILARDFLNFQPDPETGARKIGLARSPIGPPDPNAHPWSDLIGEESPADYQFKFYTQSEHLTVEYYADFIYMVDAKQLIEQTSLVTDGSFESGVNNWGKQG